MKLSDFDYVLPPEYIAQRPVNPRDHSRLMVLGREKRTVEHYRFYDLIDLLRSDDVLVANKSRVIPARLYGRADPSSHEASKDTGAGRIEILLLKRLDEQRWEAMGKPGKRLRVGAKIRFQRERDERGERSDCFRATVKERTGRTFVLRFNRKGRALSEAIHEYGVMPTPPYIEEDLRKPDSYQTVYADKEGSVAAPTAGLHFTPELMKKLKDKRIKFEFVDLHVGLGTFLPVKTDKVEEHEMHSEYFELSKEVARRLNKYKKEGRRIVAVGTTSVRVLESCVGSGAGRAESFDRLRTSGAEGAGRLKASSGETDIFIYPGYEFKFVDAMITNFHLPKSTLLMLISAFADREFVLKAYEEAVREKYRFYSFGDAMLIV